MGSPCYQWRHYAAFIGKRVFLAREILDPLLINSEQVTVIPGNHDRYVNQQMVQIYLLNTLENFLARMKYMCLKLIRNGSLVGWDSAHPNDLRTAAGTVKDSTIQATEKLLKNFTRSDKLYCCKPFPFDIS